MKKIFISILSAAMFAACAKTETEDVIPVNPEPEDEAQTVYVEIGATTGSDTKATYDKDLKAYWEAGDQILAVQGSATSKTNETGSSKEYTANAESLMLSNGDNTNEGTFNGNITVHDSNNRYFHFAYPSNTTLRTITKTNGYSGIDKSYATTTTCTYTVPSEQDGKWTPFLCTSTTEKTTAANIKNIDFGTSLNACLAVRVFYHDGKTPKPVKRIRITSGNNIVGTISATTANDGAFSADMFASAGGGTEINADNLHTIAKLGNNYEYRFEVLPVDAGVLTVELVDAAGSKIIRQTNPKTFKANTRSGVNVVWDDATVNIDDKPLTWYDDYAKNGFSDMGANSVYVKGAKIRGVGIENVKVIGVRLRKLTDDGQETGDENITYHPNPDLSSLSSDENGTLSFDSQLDNIPSGNYYVRPYAIIINSDGAEQEIISTVHTAIVTGDLDIIIRSSYNNNRTVAKTNDLNGDKIYVSLKDAFAAKNLTASSTFHYGNNDPLVVTGSAEFETGSIAPQQYSNCYAEIELKNGYKFTTQSYTINVTGIPYWWKNNNSGEEVASGNTINGTCNVYIPSDLSNVYIDYDINVRSATLKMTGTLTVNNNTIFSVTPDRNSSSRQTNKHSMSISTGAINFSYTNSRTGSAVAKSTIYKVGLIYY